MVEKFILVSLEEEKAKKLAEIISNNTCRRILDYLSENEVSETDISKNLNIPISTVHYNLKHLLKHNLIEIKDFYWSDKGNKVYVYRVAKKIIVIAPKGTTELKTKLKSILPVVLISAAAAGVIRFFSKSAVKLTDVQYAATKSITEAVSAGAAMPQITNIIPNHALWFLVGALFSLIIYLIWNWRSKR